MHERSTIFIADVPSIISALWIWSQVELSRSICTWTVLFFFLLSVINACSRWKKRKAVCTVCEASWGCTMQFLSLLWIKRNKKDPHYSHPSFFFKRAKTQRTLISQNLSASELLWWTMLALQAACKQMRWAFIDFYFFYFLCHSPDNRTIYALSDYTFFSLNKSGKNKASLSKQMSEETLTWGGWDEKYRWSAQAYWVHLWYTELVPCNFIPSMIWCGEEKKIFTALLS